MVKNFLTIVLLINSLMFINAQNNPFVKKNIETRIIKETEEKPVLSPDSVYNASQVTISAVLFEANVEDMRERGINWTGMLSKHGLRIGSDFKTFDSNTPNGFDLALKGEGNIGQFSGYANALFRFFENENLGEIISRLSVTVSNGQKGRMQVGSDISVKQLDFAGNVSDHFIPTGTIIEVTPYIHKKDTTDFARLLVHVERSTPFPDELSTEIKKTSSSTEVIMFNNEEAIVGGLLVTQDINIRKGVPILKDLPWWVLGLKYIFGYDQKVTVKKEIVILLRIDIIPALKDRKLNSEENLIFKKLSDDRQDVERYRTKKTENNEK